MFNCIQRRPAEFIQSLPIQSPFEGCAHFSTVQPKIDVGLFVSNGVLGGRESDVHCRMGERTLIMAKRTLAESKATFAGAMLETSFALFKASMVPSNVDSGMMSLPFCRWNLGAIVEACSSCQRAVRPMSGRIRTPAQILTCEFNGRLIKSFCSTLKMPASNITRGGHSCTYLLLS